MFSFLPEKQCLKTWSKLGIKAFFSEFSCFYEQTITRRRVGFVKIILLKGAEVGSEKFVWCSQWFSYTTREDLSNFKIVGYLEVDT